MSPSARNFIFARRQSIHNHGTRLSVDTPHHDVRDIEHYRSLSGTGWLDAVYSDEENLAMWKSEHEKLTKDFKALVEFDIKICSVSKLLHSTSPWRIVPAQDSVLGI